jgi:hypothetical protein
MEEPPQASWSNWSGALLHFNSDHSGQWQKHSLLGGVVANGMAPKELAPHRFQQARYHYRTVHQELKKFNWIKNIKNINTEETMDEFILLFSVVNDVSLNDGKY